jgi:phage terminase large subunit
LFQSPTIDTAESVAIETYRPFPRQQAFHASPAKYRLFGGAAGPGKSRALVEEGHQTCLEAAGVDVLILRRTFKELEASIINQYLREVPYRRLRIKYNGSDHVAQYPNGSRLIFGYCRSERDVFQYQGGAYAQILIDELTFFTLPMWQFLTSRNRADGKRYTAGRNKGLPVFPTMAGASNPGNTGHQFCKKLFIEHAPAPGMEHPEKYDASEYDFIPARLDDNPIYANDEDYRATLEALPEMLRRAFLEGDWNVFAGQYFDIFQRGTHTAPPEELIRKPWMPCWISIDWGFSHPAAVYWHYQDGQKTVTYRELVTHKPGEQGKGLTPIQLAEKIVGLMADNGSVVNGKWKPLDEKIHEIYLSTEVFREHSWGEGSIPELMNDVFLANGLPHCAPADNDRVGGWMLMYQLMQNECWVISEACPRLIETLPMMTRDMEKNPEDCQKVDGDDPPDAARYGLKSKLSPGRKPVSLRVAERVEALHIPADNPTATMMMAAKISAEERKKGKPIRLFGPRHRGFRP